MNKNKKVDVYKLKSILKDKIKEIDNRLTPIEQASNQLYELHIILEPQKLCSHSGCDRKEEYVDSYTNKIERLHSEAFYYEEVLRIINDLEQESTTRRKDQCVFRHENF